MHTDAATLQRASIWREASRIVREEGFRAFWKGNLVTIAHRLPYSSVNFYAYEEYKKVGINIMLMTRFNEVRKENFKILFVFSYIFVGLCPATIFCSGCTKPFGKYECGPLCTFCSRWLGWNNSCICYISIGSCENTPCSSGDKNLIICVDRLFLSIILPFHIHPM